MPCIIYLYFIFEFLLLLSGRLMYIKTDVFVIGMTVNLVQKQDKISKLQTFY